MALSLSLTVCVLCWLISCLRAVTVKPRFDLETVEPVSEPSLTHSLPRIWKGEACLPYCLALSLSAFLFIFSNGRLLTFYHLPAMILLHTSEHLFYLF